MQNFEQFQNMLRSVEKFWKHLRKFCKIYETSKLNLLLKIRDKQCKLLKIWDINDKIRNI